VSADSKTQRAIILAVLLEARGHWVGLPRILELKISQFGARILELRRLGFDIENRQETVDGQRRSWYRLLPRTEHQQALRFSGPWNYPNN